MGIFSKIKERKERKAAEKARWENPTQPTKSTRTSYASQRGEFGGFTSRAGESKGDQPQPPQKRKQQTPITPLEIKSGGIDKQELPPQELKGSRPSAEALKPTEPKLNRKERKELERVTKAKAAVQRRKDAMAKKEAASKAVKDEEAGARIYGIGKQVGDKKKVEDTSTSTDTKSKEQITTGIRRRDANPVKLGASASVSQQGNMTVQDINEWNKKNQNWQKDDSGKVFKWRYVKHKDGKYHKTKVSPASKASKAKLKNKPK